MASLKDIRTRLPRAYPGEVSLLEASQIPWITPDTLKAQDDHAVALIYTADHEVFAKAGLYHVEIINKEPRLMARYGRMFGQADDATFYRDRAEKFDLFGRIGRTKINSAPALVLSLWNDQALCDRLLPGLLKKVRAKLPAGCYLSTSWGGTVPLDEPKDLLREWEQSNKPSKPLPYLNPDTFYCKHGSTTFIYTTDGEIYYGIGHTDSHYEIMARYPELYRGRYDLEKYFLANGITVEDPTLTIADMTKDDWATYANHPQARDIGIKQGDLYGRVGKGGRLGMPAIVVSFWNHDPSDYAILPDCLQQLTADGVIAQDVQVSTPVHGTVPAGDLEVAKVTELDDKGLEQLELYKQLHLMRGAQKREAMKKLGVGGQKPHPMQTAMDYAGLRVPGQKWWAMHSEGMESSLEGKLSRILESL